MAPRGFSVAQQPVVQVGDGAGNVVSQAAVTAPAAIATGGGTLGGTLTAATTGTGVASFTNLSISGTVGDRTLSFSATGFTGVTSAVTTVAAGAPSQLTLTTQPSPTTPSGVAFAQQPVVQLRDGAGNPVSQAGVVVTAAIATGAGTLGGTPTATTTASGVASFTNLSISGTVGERTLSFSATGFVMVASGPVNVTPGAATQLTVTTQPSATAQSGVAFAQQPVVQLRDGSGNPVSQAGVVVTAAIATGSGTLGGTLPAPTTGTGVFFLTIRCLPGSAGFPSPTLLRSGFVMVASGPVTVTPGAATQLTVTTQPSATAQSGVVFAQQPVVQLRDGAGNPVSQAGVAVTAAIATGGGTLGGTLTATTDRKGGGEGKRVDLGGPPIVKK